MKPTIYIFLALVLLSCSDNPEKEIESTSYEFLPRKCSFIKTKHMKIVPDEPDLDGSPIYAFDVLPKGEGVKTQNYILYSVNFNQIFERIPDDYDIANMPLYQLLPPDASKDAHDMEIEDQIKKFLRRRNNNSDLKNSSMDQVVLEHVEYRTNQIRRIDVYSTTGLFNRPKESSLIDLLKIETVCNGCIFDHDKQLIDMMNRSMSLEQYNNYQPYASAFMQLQFKISPPEAPLETQFIFEMEMANGEVLRDTTETVNLLP